MGRENLIGAYTVDSASCLAALICDEHRENSVMCTRNYMLMAGDKILKKKWKCRNLQ